MSSSAKCEPLHLLKTKLFRPRPTGDLLHRTRLHDTLDSYLDRSVTLVSAPAGFGKTTMLSDWLEHSSCISAWLSLDEGDSDLPTFLAYFVAAVRTLFPGACADTLAALQAPVLPPLAILATTLANDLEALAEDETAPRGSSSCQRFVLVLDDYHHVREPAVHTLLAQLLRHPPSLLHLLVSTRQDPPFIESALRARSDFSEIRATELRFTPEETASFMQRVLKTRLDADTLARLVNATEGWSTGLRLSALTLQAGGDLLGSDMVSYNRHTLDYLLAEVLARVPLATRDFLLKTSILDRLSGPLCDAIAPPADPEWDGRAYLHWLATENLFTFSFDAQGNWYRYHHLFQKMLQAQLERQMSVEEIAELRRRASAWYAERGLIQEAIQYALAAGDELTAAQLVEKHGGQAVDRGRWRQIEQWLSRLPRRLIDGRPGLLMLQAWLVQNQWRYQDLPAYLDRIAALLQQEPQSEPEQIRIAGELDALRCMAFYYSLHTQESIACAERALAMLPLECSTARGIAWLYLSNRGLLVGDAQAAVDTLHEALKEDAFHGSNFPTAPFVGLGLIYWMRADLANLFLVAGQLLQIAQQRELTEALGWAHYFRGCARYQQNDLAGAEAELSAAVRQRYFTNAHPYSQSGLLLALTLVALGKTVQAYEVLDSVAGFGMETNNGRIIMDAQAARACLALRTGSVAEAQRWAAEFDPHTPLMPLTTPSVPHLVRVKALVAEGSPESLATAARDLAPLRNQARAFNTRFMIEILALEALIHDGQRDQSAAFDALRQALELAESVRLIRIFIDLGPKMRQLLTQFVAHYGPTEYRRQLLAAFAAETSVSGHEETLAIVQGTRGEAAGDPVIEPLSCRELDVLWLLSQRYTDKEIAGRLYISPQTVKRHAANIYQKLQVGSRRNAVARAAALGLLPCVPSDGSRLSG